MLNAEHEDILTELVNIGIGRAAYTLSEMVDSHVGLQVPSLSLASLGLAPLTRYESGEESVSVVVQGFTGGLVGTAVLAIPQASARKLVAVLTNTPSESATIDVEREGVITEVGNIVINSVLGSLGNLTSLDFDFGLPHYEESLAPPLEALAARGSQVVVGVLFQIQSHAIEGKLAVVFDVPSLDGVWALLDPSICPAATT